MITRRSLLKRAVGAAAGTLSGIAGPALRALRAMGHASLFRFAQVRYEGNWHGRPTAPTTILSEVDLRTSVRVSFEPVSVSPAQSRLFRFPFLWLTGDRAFAPWPDQAVRNLRRHLRFGGMLFADDISGREDSAFSRSFGRELNRILPGRDPQRLSSEHALYRSYYYISRPAGLSVRNGFMDAVSIDDRAAVLWSRNDLSGALARSKAGGWRYELKGNEPDGRELAVRLGVNLVVYALSVNYKRDQVHVSYRLRHPTRYPETSPPDR